MSGQQAISSTPLRGNDIPVTRLSAVITEGGDAPAGRGTPYVMGPNDTFRGTITSNDIDWVRIQMTAGQQYTISLDGLTLADTYLELRDSTGALIAYNDDAGSWDHSQITFTATTSGRSALCGTSIYRGLPDAIDWDASDASLRLLRRVTT